PQVWANKLDDAIATAGPATEKPPEAKTAEEQLVGGNDLNSCKKQRTESLKECMQPSGVGFKEIMGIVSGLCGAIASFSMGSGDGSEESQQQAQKSCMLAGMCQQLGSG